MKLQMFKLDLEKAEEPEIKLPTSAGSSKKQESSRKTSTSALLIRQSLWLSGSQQTGKFFKRLKNFNLTSLKFVFLSSHLILCHPLLLLPPIPPSIRVSSNEAVIPFSSCPQSLPASESLPMSQLFAWGGQSTGVSALASFLPKNTQDWSPLEWTGWISLQSKGLTRVFSNITVQKHQFFGAQLSSQSNSHIHTWPLEKS